MQVKRLNFDTISQLSVNDIGYAGLNPALAPFYKYVPKLENFKKVIADKQQEATDRDLLVSVFKAQYKTLSTGSKHLDQIELLAKENTFTVVTAHQPSLFTGPLYTIYKSISCIKLSRVLSAAYPEYNFIPLFVTGGEDHDFEEMNHIKLFSHEFEWTSNQQGAVGRMKTDGVREVFTTLKEVLGDSENAEALKSMLAQALKQDAYGKSFQDLMVQLLGSYGLLVLNMDNQALKKSFIPHIEKEIFEQPSQNYILKAQADIEAAGFKAQAYPREINFFYLGDNFRERIVLENDQYQINDQDITFTAAELKAEIQNHPERFSPNVIMRPIYQEFCLPNLAYIGGGGEIAYWLERKVQFAEFGVNFPMLIRRNSAMWIDKGNAKNMENLNFTIPDLFQHEHDLVKQFVKDVATEDLHLKAETEALKSIYEKIQARAARINPGLEKSIIAESVKNVKQFESIESKLVKAEKKKNEVELNRISKLKEKLFPGDSLQERKNNFMEMYLKHGSGFFDILLEELNPLEEGFIVFAED